MTLHLNKKKRIVPSRETSAISQNSFFSYNQRIKSSRAQKDLVGTYSTSFWKVGVFLAVRSPIIFWKVRTKNIKTVAYKTKRRRPRFRNERIKKFFKSIRYRKTSQTQDVKSQSTKRSLRELAQPKRDSAFEQIKRIVPSRETSGSSQNIIFSYNQRNNQSRAQTDIFGTYSTSFWKVWVFLSLKSPNISRKVWTKGRKSSEQLHPIQNDDDHVSEKNQKLFL